MITTSGELKYVVSFLTYVERRDKMGGRVGSWVTKHQNIPAYVEDFGGKEKFSDESNREVSYDKKRIKVRYLKTVNHKDRILYDGKQYDIVKIEQLGFHEATRFIVEILK